MYFSTLFSENIPSTSLTFSHITLAAKHLSKIGRDRDRDVTVTVTVDVTYSP